MGRKGRTGASLPKGNTGRDRIRTGLPEQIPKREENFSIWKGLILAFLSPIISFAVQSQLDPSHGSLPSAEYRYLLEVILLAVAGFSILLQSYRPGSLATFLPTDSTVAKLIPIFAAWIPVIQLYLVPAVRRLGPAESALLINAATIIPMQLLILLATSMSFRSWLPKSFAFAAGLATTIAIPFVTRDVWQSYYAQIIQAHWLLSRPFLILTVASISMLLTPSRLLLFAALPFMHTLLLNPHSTLSMATARLNSTLESYDYSLLHREEGLTGYLSVLENKKQGFRVMRCDHSVLGGNWVPGVGSWPGGHGFKGKIGRVAEPVYAVFTMLEAVRLVRAMPLELEEHGQENQPVVPDHQAQALVMYLIIPL